MTARPRARELTRRYLEAVAVAQAVVDPSVAAELLARIDPLCVSPAVVALLAGVAEHGEAVEVATKGQRDLRDHADALTLRDLRGIDAHSFDTLVALLNQLPQRPAIVPAWERDLAAGLVGGIAGAITPSIERAS